MTRERPWWASDGPVDGGVDVSEDPVERIRSARRGPRRDHDAGADPADPHAGDLPFADEPGPGGPRDGDEAGASADDPRPGPWWEAAADTVSRLARDLAETAEAHEPRPDAEREPPGRGAAPGARGAPPPDDERAIDDGTGDPTNDATGAAADDAPHRIDACGVCPICVGLRTLGESRPELVGHLAEAARHVAMAARSLAARPPSTHRDDEHLQHIDLDD